MKTLELQAEPRWVKACLWTLLAVCVIRLWLMPLPSSFWVDEMGTVFVAEHGGSHPSFAIAPQVPNSIYYALPKFAAWIAGSSEVVYRIPSVLAIAGAVLLVALIARRLIHPMAGWLAVFSCLALKGINYQAADARPYGFGSFVAAGSMFFLIRWMDEGRWRDGALFALCGALLWRVHLIFWPFYFVFAGYAALRLLRPNCKVNWTKALAVFAVMAAMLMPVLLDAMALFREAGAHVIAKPPSLHTFEHALRWNIPVICGASAWLLARMFGWRRLEHAKPTGASWELAVGWWLCTPVCLFAFSWITGNSVFITRYISLMLCGLALTTVAAVARFTPPVMWNRLALLVGLGGLIVLGQWNRIWPVHERSDWRGAASLVNTLAGPDTPVICPSPFIEARPPEWRPDYPLPGFLYSYLPVYPIHGKVLLFPFESSPVAEAHALQVSGNLLAHSSRFLIYGGNGATRYWRKWLMGRPELAGWRFTRHEFGDVDVIAFDPPVR